MKRNIDCKSVWVLILVCYYLIDSLSPKIPTLYNTGVKKYTDMSNSVSRFFAEKKVRRESSVEWYQNEIAIIKALEKAIQYPKDRDIIGWHRDDIIDLYNAEIKNFNIAIMRETHGAQYKGAEISMKSPL